MLILALVIGAAWAAGIIVYLFEIQYSRNLSFLYPAIDGVAVAILAPIGLRPKYPGRLIYALVIGLLAAQALFRLAMTTLHHAAPELDINIPWLLNFFINRAFDIIILSIIAIAILRIRRIARDKAAEKEENAMKRAQYFYDDPPRDGVQEVLEILRDAVLSRLGRKGGKARRRAD